MFVRYNTCRVGNGAVNKWTLNATSDHFISGRFANVSETHAKWVWCWYYCAAAAAAATVVDSKSDCNEFYSIWNCVRKEYEERERNGRALKQESRKYEQK